MKSRPWSWLPWLSLSTNAISITLLLGHSTNCASFGVLLWIFVRNHLSTPFKFFVSLDGSILYEAQYWYFELYCPICELFSRCNYLCVSDRYCLLSTDRSKQWREKARISTSNDGPSFTVRSNWTVLVRIECRVQDILDCSWYRYCTFTYGCYNRFLVYNCVSSRYISTLCCQCQRYRIYSPRSYRIRVFFV